MLRRKKNQGNDVTPPPTTEPELVATADDAALPGLASRDAVFGRLRHRVGNSLATDMREDFDGHIADDPVNGVESAWMCLSMKLIDAVDRLNDTVSGRPLGSTSADADAAEAGHGGTVSPFTVYRKNT